LVQRCWSKGPLGPTIAWGCFVLYFFNEENEEVRELKRAFGARVVKTTELAVDLDEVPFEKALLWCWS